MHYTDQGHVTLNESCKNVPCALDHAKCSLRYGTVDLTVGGTVMVVEWAQKKDHMLSVDEPIGRPLFLLDRYYASLRLVNVVPNSLRSLRVRSGTLLKVVAGRNVTTSWGNVLIKFAHPSVEGAPLVQHSELPVTTTTA
uniref:Uncharacterized protein n=1 Tax=Anopheles coluzzii TaxID=1518534 RepID=A0A8W7PDJ7_ANOCL